MADVGLFKRLGNLWMGFLSIWISNVEKEHPEIAYENAINSLVGKYSKLKSATAAIIRRREDVDERLKKAQKDLAQTELELNAAVETNQDDLAVVLIQRKNALATDVAELTGDLSLAEVLVVAEHDRGPLPQREPEQGHAHRFAVRGVRAARDDLVVRGRALEVPAFDEPASPVRA